MNKPATTQTDTPFGNVVLSGQAEKSVLILNAGSSSLKFALFPADSPQERLLAGNVQGIGLPEGDPIVTPGMEHLPTPRLTVKDHVQALDLIIEQMSQSGMLAGLAAIGHRVLHGGNRYTAPHLVDTPLMEELWKLCPIGPEHQPAQLKIIETLRQRFPQLPQVACFDTAFHRNLPRVARLLPLPRRYEAAGVRRYGFHGLSYEFLMNELARQGNPLARHGRIILAHLGNGASMAAVRDGECIDTSMAFTPAAGLVMGRRTGDLDPGLFAYLSRTEGMTAAQFGRMVNHESGLLGVSEITSDMRELLALERSDPRAADAIALFCYQAKKWLGAFTAALGGLDLAVFTGGIGENNAGIRARICADLDFLGLELDEKANTANTEIISTVRSRVEVRVIRTDEERVIARSVRRVLGLGHSENKECS